MKLPPIFRQRRWLWLAGGIALFAAYLLFSEPAGEPTPPSPPSPVRPLAAAPAPAANLPETGEPMGTPVPPPPAADIFAVRNWEPPAPVVDTSQPAAPPPPPEAPPLPFRYAGRLDEPGKATVFFLLRDDEVLAVSPGDVIEGKYRVGKLQGGQLHFFYRPMKIEQLLSVGDDS